MDDHAKLKAIERELSLRRHVYPSAVRRGTMTQATADREIKIFEAIRDDYQRKIAPRLFTESGSPA